MLKINKSGPILLVEDDHDDQALFKKAVHSLGIAVKVDTAANGEEALVYLRNTPQSPFIIVADINMPRMNGIELLRTIVNDPELKKKSIPFIIMSSAASNSEIIEAYELSVQGYFQKPQQFEELRRTINMIFVYWTKCHVADLS